MFIQFALAVALVGGPLPVTDGEPINYPSVHHAAMMENQQQQPVEVSTFSTGGSRELSSTVFGFLPFWVNQAWLQYDLLSVLAVFSVDMGSDGSITNSHGFPEVFATAMDQAHANGAQVVVTVTNFSGSSIHSILTTGRANAISSITNLVAGTVVDGVCIDFENVLAGDRDSLVTFMEDLRAAMQEAHISICTPVIDWSGAFNYSELALSCDALMMMCYAFAGSCSSVAGPNAPLTGWGSTPESSSNMAWALCDYVRYAPEVHEKLVVGLPYYGHQWHTSSQYPHSSCSNCATLFYTTLAERAETYGRLWDDESLTPYYVFNSGGWRQGWFDDAESLELKYDMVTSAGLQGIGIWALGYDGDRPELWDLLDESFTTPPVNDMITDNLEASCTLHGPPSYWHPYTEDGIYHTYFYTGSIASGPDVNWVEWNCQVPDAASEYFLEAFIPQSGTAQVTYHIIHGLGEDSVTVEQSAFPGQWVGLGGPYDPSGGLHVQLGDWTGSSGERIVVDAIRFTEFTGIDSQESFLPSHGLTISQSPAPCITVVSSCSGVLSVCDISGRVVAWREMAQGECWTWNENHPAGVYLLNFEHGGSIFPARVVLVR